MPVLTHTETLLIGAIVAPALFAASILLTGARGRPILGGVAGVAAYGIVTFTWDHVASMAGWWHYPYDPKATWQALGLDLIAGVVAGGAFGLMGWRLRGRFGRRGLVCFLVVWSIWGAVHDLGGSRLFAARNLMIFTPGITPALADVLNYATSAAIAQVAIRVVGGPAPPATGGARTGLQPRGERGRARSKRTKPGTGRSVASAASRLASLGPNSFRCSPRHLPKPVQDVAVKTSGQLRTVALAQFARQSPMTTPGVLEDRCY